MVESELEARPDLLPSFLDNLHKSDLSKEQRSSVIALIQVIPVLTNQTYQGTFDICYFHIPAAT